MNLSQLVDFLGNLLDYDPTNTTYTQQITNLLNDAQTRVLTDKKWSFAVREAEAVVFTDDTATITVANGSVTATGAGFPVSSNVIRPGSAWDGARVEFTDSSGSIFDMQVAWVENANNFHFTTPFAGANGTYSATIKQREVYLPGAAMNLLGVRDPSQGTPANAPFISKFERNDLNLDPDKLGTVERWSPSVGHSVVSPRIPTTVSVITPGAGRGIRTIKLYMVNVLYPGSANVRTYRDGVSDGFESGLSQVGTYVLADGEDLSITPETLPDETGLYRRFYFTCEEAGIVAPLRLREGYAPNVGRDTISPAAGVAITPNTTLSVLQSQAWRSTAIRYVHANAGTYQSIQLYPHPSANQKMLLSLQVAPEPMQEDQDTPLIPAAYASIIAYTAMEQVTLKVATPALSAVYERKAMKLYREMEARYLGKPTRRIVKGEGAGPVYPNIFGPLTFTP